MRVEVIYESTPYEINSGLVVFYHRDRALRKVILEVESYKDIYETLNSEEGFSNHIISSAVLNESELYDDAANRKRFKDTLYEHLDSRGLIGAMKETSVKTNYKSNQKLNLIVKSWDKNNTEMEK